jgi:phosphate transport system substrate-binding protein
MLQQLEPYRPVGNIQGSATLSGSTTMNDLGVSWANQFRKFHPKVEFVKGEEGTEKGIADLARNPKVIAGVSRAIDERDLDVLKSGVCKEPLPFIVAFEAMALFVNKSNPLEAVTPEQLQAIFMNAPDGKKRTWGQLNVKGNLANQPVNLYQRLAESGSMHYINKILLGGGTAAAPVKTAHSSLEICELVAKDPAGVGIAGIEGDVENTKPVDLLINNQRIAPTDANILTGKYPLLRPLMLVIDKKELENDGGLRRAVLRFVLSKDGQMEVIKAGFYPVDPGFNRQQLDKIVASHSR